MLIGEASRQTGLSAKTIRFYSDEGLVHPRKDPFTGYRVFTEKELTRLRFLKRARQFDFSIRDCSQLLSLYDQPDRSSLDVKNDSASFQMNWGNPDEMVTYCWWKAESPAAILATLGPMADLYHNDIKEMPMIANVAD